METKRNGGLIAIIVILLILLLGACGYILWDKVLKTKNEVPKEENTSLISDDSQEDAIIFDDANEKSQSIDTSRVRKSAFIDEGISLVDAAKIAYQAEQISGDEIKANSSVCFSVSWLNRHGYFDKGSPDDGYTGSVAVIYNDGFYIYKYWLSNGSYSIANADLTNTSVDIVRNVGESVTDCPGAETSITKS